MVQRTKRRCTALFTTVFMCPTTTRGRQPERARSEPMGALLTPFNKISHWSFFHVAPYLHQWPLFSVRPSRRRSDKLINVYEGNDKFRDHEFQEN
jgi:hypothetical protein